VALVDYVMCGPTAGLLFKEIIFGAVVWPKALLVMFKELMLTDPGWLANIFMLLCLQDDEAGATKTGTEVWAFELIFKLDLA